MAGYRVCRPRGRYRWVDPETGRQHSAEGGEVLEGLPTEVAAHGLRTGNLEPIDPPGPDGPYDGLKGPELKAILEDRALPTTGKVAELRERLEESDREKAAQAAAATDGESGTPGTREGDDPGESPTVAGDATGGAEGQDPDA